MSIIFHPTSAWIALQMRIAIYRFQALNHSISHRPGPRIMPYALLADVVLVLHATFILFVVLGGLLVLWRRGLAWFHVPGALWGILIEFRGWVCPLTYLENDLRAAAGASGYPGGYIDHYLMPLVYPPGLTFDTQVLLGLAALLINAIIYALVWRKFRAKSDRFSQ
jgi:hypothetical protein